MSRQTWQETLIAAEADSTALTASVTATSILPAAARLTLPANYFDIGKALRVRAWGRVTTVTTPGTYTIAFMLGPTSNIAVFSSGAITGLNATAQTNATWWLELMLTCRAIGASAAANLMGAGQWTSRAVIGSGAAGATGVYSQMLPDTAPAVGTGFDSTVSNVADLFWTWGTNNANSIQTHQYTLESLN